MHCSMFSHAVTPWWIFFSAPETYILIPTYLRKYFKCSNTLIIQTDLVAEIHSVNYGHVIFKKRP